ncbi:hypothetical protein K7432_017781 [Basidiobolus ranarum]|uniref:Uncharacterized protein n=1 Tax=Basidiobolus ranarum TaxID=34480 RepID=A0ABR2VKZ1_9FUNG
MKLPQFYDQNDVGQNATLVKPVSPDNLKNLLLDVDLGYSSTNGSKSEVEEEDDALFQLMYLFHMEKLSFFASISDSGFADLCNGVKILVSGTLEPKLTGSFAFPLSLSTSCSFSVSLAAFLSFPSQ